MERTKLELNHLQKREQLIPLHIQCPPTQDITKSSTSSNIVASDTLTTNNKDLKSSINNSQENLTKAKTDMVKFKPNCEKQVDKRNEIWQILHPNEPIGNISFDYALSYEVDPKKKAPPEVEELGRLFGLML